MYHFMPLVRVFYSVGEGVIQGGRGLFSIFFNELDVCIGVYYSAVQGVYSIMPSYEGIRTDSYPWLEATGGGLCGL